MASAPSTTPFPVAELKSFVVLHGRAQGLPERLLREGLAAIDNDVAGDPASWTAIWMRLAARVDDDDPLTAMGLFNMARFPCLADSARAEAHQRCIARFAHWRAAQHSIERLELDGRGAVYAAGLDDDRPLLVIVGGIVSIKEQWWRLLRAGVRLGFAVAVAEMPGVGENRVRYDGRNADFFPAVIDRIGTRARTGHTQLMALSFSGHLALRSAAVDDRIAAIATVGAPIADVFLPPPGRPPMPALSQSVLAHLMDVPVASLPATLSALALDRSDLAGVRIPVAYLASRRDEIIPHGEIDHLIDGLADFTHLTVDDVHGAPNHPVLTRLFMTAALVRNRRPERPVMAGLTAGLLRLARWHAGGAAA